ncbi:MAG: PLP-dependent transferase [Thermoplasmata archaeon]|nr:MAG: PLP-dependent transferase [Thermoplasmata archaeon]
MLKVVDVPSIAELANENDIIFCVDATFSTPINQHALEQGADIVIHSTSKYLSGHSDLIGGIVASNKQNIEKIWQRMTKYGGCMNPFQAYMLLRSMKTLHIRMKTHNENAMGIAEFLEKKVKKVIYPGLESHEQYEIAKRLLKGYGGMVSFVLGKNEYGLKFMRRLKIIKEASSLGGIESLMSMPFNTSHSYLSNEERKKWE